MENRKLLYINHDFPPMGGPGVWRALWFTKYLIESGYDVTVVCSDRSNWCSRYDDTLLKLIPSNVKIIRIKSIFLTDLFSKVEKLLKIHKKNLINNFYMKIKWRVFQYYPEPNLWWFLKASLHGIYLSIFRSFNCIITSGPPHISHVAGLLISKFSSTLWIMDYRDLWTDDPGQSPTTGYQRRLFEILEREAIKNSNVVVTVSPSWKHQLTAKYREEKDESKFHLIRNGHNIGNDLDTDFVSNKPKERLHIHFNGTPQGLSRTTHLLDALCRLKLMGISDDRLPVITYTGTTGPFKDEIQERGLESIVHDVQSMSYQLSIEYSKKADVLLVIVNNQHPSRRGTIPAKTYEAMALGSHVFALIPSQSDVRELLEEYGNASICNVDDIDEIYRSLLVLITSHNNGLDKNIDLDKKNENLKKYSRRTQADQLISLIETLISENKNSTGFSRDYAA